MPNATEERPKPTPTRSIVEFLFLVGAAFLLSLVIKTFIVQPFVIPSPSLEPTIMTGDRILANMFIYRFTQPKYGDIVVFPDPGKRLPALIKRVIAVGGQTVDVRGGKVFVDGKPLDEPYVHGKRTDPGTVPLPITIPQGYVWLMGDNRPNSADARFFGPQPASAIEGEAFAIYWPPQHIGLSR